MSEMRRHAAESFLAGAARGVREGSVSKGARPDRVRLGAIPRNFKGAVQVKDLVRRWKETNGQDDDTDHNTDGASAAAAPRPPARHPARSLAAAVVVAAAVAVAVRVGLAAAAGRRR